MFYDLFINYLKCHRFDGMDLQWRVRNLSDIIKNILISVSSMKKVLPVPYDLDETLVHVLM